MPGNGGWMRQRGLELLDEPAGPQEAPKSGAARVQTELLIGEGDGDGLASIVEHHGGVHLRVKSLVTWLRGCFHTHALA